MSGCVSEELERKGLSVLLVRRGERLEPVVNDKPVQARGDKVGCNDCKKIKINKYIKQ